MSDKAGAALLIGVGAFCLWMAASYWFHEEHDHVHSCPIDEVKREQG